LRQATFIAMNGYLFTAGITRMQSSQSFNRYGHAIQNVQPMDYCKSAIIYGSDAQLAQKQFEAWCRKAPEGENPPDLEIKKLVAAQLVDELITESGGKPLDWPELSQQINDLMQATPADDFEQGYWVDIGQALPPGKISFDIDCLKRDLPEDIRSGLNWSPDKKFFFLISVLSPYVPPPDPFNEPEPDETNPGEASDENTEDNKPDLDGFIASLPDMRDMEAAALVEARNSVVAAWLWRKFAASTKLATNEINITPCCDIVPVE
jgi:hypothetical protein